MRYPLTDNQKKLFRHFEFYPNDPTYNLVGLYKITGELDQERLKNAIEMVGNSIDLFKVHFEREGDELFQVYSSEREWRVEIIKKSKENEILQHASRCCKEPINLTEWPLIEFTIYSLENKEWYLLLNKPHILSDGFSYSRLIESIQQSYDSLAKDTIFKESFLGRPTLLENPKSLPFFQKELSGLDSLEVKTIKQERNGSGFLEGKTEHFAISKEIVAPCLKKFSFSESAFFLSLHALLLKKLCEEEHIVIGVPTLNRTGIDKSIFGYFVNTLPLLIDFQSVDSLKTLVETIHKKMMRLLRHQSFDLNQLNEFDQRLNNFFTFYAQELNFQLENCSFERIYFDKKAIFSEFTFTVEKRKDDYMFCIESGETFKSVEFEKIVRAFLKTILRLENPLIKDIQMVDEQGYYEKLNSYSPYDEVSSIHQEFERVAARYPDKIALHDFQSELSYRELDQKSNQIARFLLEKAPDAEQVILSTARNCHLIAIILGILKAGKCYVPIDQFCPIERFQYILNSQESAYIIGDGETQKKYQLFSDRFIPVDELLEQMSSLSTDSLSLPTPSKAYIIYTSGTTGHPKGVQITHRNLLSLLKAAKEKFSFNSTDIWTLFHSYAFDFSVWEIFGSLLSGAKLLILDGQIAKNPTQFYSIVSDHKVTVLNQTPTAFREFIRVDWFEQKPLELHTIIFGGEALAFQNLKDWVEMHPLSQTKLINMYGITETTIHVTYYEIKQEDLEKKESIIGKPLSNLAVHIFNSEEQIVPHGMKGEIAIYGDGLSSGYYNAPELTAKKFVVKDGCTFYLSGDLGRVDEEGNLVFLGRKDRQVQIRGYRVELDEISFHILKTGLVQQCAIDVLEVDQNGKIVAYLVAKNGSELLLREQLKKALPFYMIPAIFLYVEAIPLTINGKIDFASLRSRLQTREETKILDDSPTEVKLRTLIAALLKRGDFSSEENFWDIGLSSIDLASIYYSIKTQFSFDGISMAHLFQYTTLKKLANYIDRASSKLSCLSINRKEERHAK